MVTQRHGPLCHEYGIRGWGNPDEGVVVVGIAPGMDEAEKTKRPFTGMSGQLLDACLKYSGWHRDKVYTTNTICWFNNAPNSVEIEECRPRLTRELRDINPRLIITAGTIANGAITGAKRRKGSRGSVVWSEYWNCYILDTHHPSYALQAQSMDVVQDLIRDLGKIGTVLTWPDRAEHTKVSYELVSSLQEANRVLRSLPYNRPVTLDIETSNPDDEDIDAYTDQLLCFSVSYLDSRRQERNIVFPGAIFPTCVRDGSHARRYRDNNKCEHCNLSREVLDWACTEPVQWTFQAGQYDIHALAVYFGVTLRMHDDTMLMSLCTDERPGYHGLKTNAREFLGAGWYNEHVKSYYKGKLNQLPPEEVYEYNAKDAAYTRRLMPIFQTAMQDQGTQSLYENVLLPAVRTFTDIQIRGINIDQKRLQELAYDNWFPKYLEDYKRLQKEAEQIGWPTEDINLNSNPQLAKFFYEILGLDITKYTPAGKPSVDKETLDQMDHPFAAKLRAYRTLDKMIGYVLEVWEHLKWDGKLHPSAFVNTTRTGRTSYKNPAVQTIPKDYTVGEDYARLRETIIPHSPDTHEIIEADYNQIEVWLAWAFSRDPILLEHLTSGDVHSATAEGAFNTKRALHSKSEWAVLRQNAKKIRFGIQYGEGAEKLSSPPPVGIGGTPAAAQVFITNFKRTYPTYTRWMVDIQKEARSQGYLRSPSGRVMRFPVILDHKQLRQAINFPIQDTASEYNLLSMIELHAKLRELNSYILLNIHDCLVVESDRRYRPQVIALMREIMQREWFEGFPSIKVDVKVGDSLGTVKALA